MQVNMGIYGTITQLGEYHDGIVEVESYESFSSTTRILSKTVESFRKMMWLFLF